MTYWSISSSVLTEEAKKLWLEVEIISKEKNLFYIKWNWKEIMFKSTDFWVNSSVWLKISDDKELTYKILEKYNFPIAKTWYILPEELNNITKMDITFPVIIKPLEEWHGNWVMMDIINLTELKQKLMQSFDIYNKMIIQSQIKWEEYRVLILDWNVIIAINRANPTIVGNWINTIKDLITIENKTNILRWEWYKSPLSYIKVDNELYDYIEKQWMNVETIPKKWECLMLRWNSNVWTGWTIIDVTNKINKETKEICILAVKSLGLEFAGIDIITTDITKPLHQTWWIILEINPTPWIWWDKELTKINTWKIILEHLFFT